MMNKLIRCKNVATGQLRLFTGTRIVDQDLLDMISLLLSVPDLSRPEEYNKLKYNLRSIEFTTGEGFEGKDIGGVWFPSRQVAAVSPERIAAELARIWVEHDYSNDSYAVAGTHYLLQTILHEALHSHVHYRFVPDTEEAIMELEAAEEKWVLETTDAMYLAFIKKYGMPIGATTLMYGIATNYLRQLPGGQRIIDKQRDWFTNSVIAINSNGITTLSIRENFRRRFSPYSDWSRVKVDIPGALEEIFKNPTVGMEQVPIIPAYEYEPEPEEGIIEVEKVAEPSIIVPVPVPPPVVQMVPPPPQATKVVPTPPKTVPAVPPPPPMEVYEADDWVLAESALLKAASAQSVKEMQADNATIITAIQKSATYAPATASRILPTAATKEVEGQLIEIARDIASHIFMQCGWNPASSTGFTNSEAVYKDIDLSRFDKGIIKSFEIQDEVGRAQDVPFTGTVRGKIFPNTKLPGYKLTLNIGGKEVKRLFVPQDKNKKYAGKADFLPGAKQAQAGDELLWISEEGISEYDIAVARANKQKATRLVGKFHNGVFIKIA